jgi:hypothetical protein
MNIYFKKLTYSSGNWSVVDEERAVVDVMGIDGTAYPSIVRDSEGKIWIAYGYWMASSDMGQVRATYSDNEFQTPGIVTYVNSLSSAPYASHTPALTIRNGYPFIVYADYPVSRLQCSYWNGTSWASPGLVVSDTAYSLDFSVAMRGSQVHVVYNAGGVGIKHIYYNGSSWVGSAMLSMGANGKYDENPSLTTNGSDLWCFASVYYGIGKYDIKYKKWHNSFWDTNWTNITTDTANNRYSTTPSSCKAYIPLAWSLINVAGAFPNVVKFTTVGIPDTIPPAVITDLSGSCDNDTGEVTLYWSTPGDDGWTDILQPGSKYRIDYSTYSIQWSTTNYKVDISTSGVAPQTKVSYTITGLQTEKTYYFRIWTRDEAGNWSALSNGATVWVPITFVWDGGGTNNNWSEAANWSGDIVPGQNDHAVFNNTSSKPCTIDIPATVASLSVRTGSTITITANQNLTVTGNFSLSTGTFNAGSRLFTIGGSWLVVRDAQFNCQTSTVTFNSNEGGKTITSGGSPFASVIFDSGNGNGGWKLQDSLTCRSLQVVDGCLNDNFQTVTVNGNIDIKDPALTRVLISSGTWIQGANGNVSNPAGWQSGYGWHKNEFEVLQIANDVTSTKSGTVSTRKLVLGTNATFKGPNDLYILYPILDDFIDMDTSTSSSTITGGWIYIYLNSYTNIKQKGLTTTSSFRLCYSPSSTIQMTGNWTVWHCYIFGSTSSTNEATAAVLNTNGYNLTVNGELKLGNSTASYPNMYYGKVIFATGTHNIRGEVYVDGRGQYSRGYFDLGSANISMGGNVNFSSATVTPGSSSVTLNGTSGQRITSAGQRFNELTITNNTNSGVTFADSLTCSTFTATTGNSRLYFAPGSTSTFTNMYLNGQLDTTRILLRSTTPGNAWYLTVTDNQSAFYVDVQDSDASGGKTIVAFKSVNSGNNKNWVFNPPAAITDLTGSCNINSGDVTLYWSTPGDDGGTDILQPGSKYRIDYSTYSIQWSTTNYKVDISTSGVAPQTKVSYTITGLQTEKTYYFRIWTQDSDGNWSGISNGATVLVTKLPPPPTISSPTHPDQAKWYNNNNPSFSWTVSNSSGIIGYSYLLDQNPGTIPDNASEGVQTSTSCTNVGDGTRYFHVKAQNSSGLWGYTAHYRINIDTTPPPAPVVTSLTHPDQSKWYGNNNPSFSWDCSDISGITGYSYLLDRVPATIPDNASEGVQTSTSCTNVGDGTRYFHVKAQNSSGLWGYTAHYRINIDTTPPPAPVVTSLTHPDQSKWYGNNNPSFSWDCSDISGITGYKYKLDQSSTTIPDGVSVTTNTFTNYTDVPSGTWHFHVKAKNGAELWGGTSHYTINIDTTIAPQFNYTIKSSTSAKTSLSFPLTIQLVDSATGDRMNDASNQFKISAWIDGPNGSEQAPGSWRIVEGGTTLVNGQAVIKVTYDTVGKIRFKVEDDPGHVPRYPAWPAFTELIDIQPLRLRYEVVAPEKVQAGKEFSLTIRLIDDPVGKVVTPIDYARRVSLVAYSKDGKPAEGELKIKSRYLEEGIIEIHDESYDLAHDIYIEASDAEVKDPAAATGRSGDIHVIGAPETVMKLEGLYNETKDALYLRNSTLINIVCISEIKAEYIYYIDNGSQRKTYEEPFSLSPGAHTIEYYGVDKYGNQEEPTNKSKRIYVAFFGDNADGLTNIPNPFKAGREETSIEYKLKEPSNVAITIYDLLGQEVWHKSYPAGENGGKESNNVSWDGRNLSGKVVANGGYVCRIWIAREKRYLVRKIGVAK